MGRLRLHSHPALPDPSSGSCHPYWECSPAWRARRVNLARATRSCIFSPSCCHVAREAAVTRAARRGSPVTSMHPVDSANGDEGRAMNQTVLRVLLAHCGPSAPPFAPRSTRSLQWVGRCDGWEVDGVPHALSPYHPRNQTAWREWVPASPVFASGYRALLVAWFVSGCKRGAHTTSLLGLWRCGVATSALSLPLSDKA